MPPPQSSDPYDDDDFFDDPSTLAAIAQVEERAIAASQAPKPSSSRYHHTIAKPSARPKPPPPAARKAPPPINTNPRVSGCGFGWEPGGKHATRLEQGLPISGMARFNTDEDQPMDVILDDKGRYGFGSAEDEPIYDQRKRPEIRQMVEAVALKTEAPRRAPSQLPGSQARRAAIASALPPREPLKRTTSSGDAAGPPAARFPPRAFSRATSTPQIGRGTSAGPSRPVSVLPPIGSQGSQPSSQGAASRRAVFELEDERRRREAIEAEVRTLRAQLAALERSASPNPFQNELQEGEYDRIARLQQELYTAQGQAATAKRNQAASEARLHAEIDKLHAEKRDMENTMRLREHEAKQRIESMKTQAVFSNHNALASASKARQQSQWPASQRGPPGSPLRDRTAMTPAPLLRSVKGKDRALPPPRFDGLNNAFAKTPNVGNRKSRQKSEGLSPTVTPKKQRRESLSPVVSPLQSQSARPGTPVDYDGDVGMDWQPNFSDAVMDHGVIDERRDLRAELQYHLLNHVASSPLHLAFRNWYEPTFIRLTRYQLEAEREVLQKWIAGATRLTAAIGASSSTFEELSEQLILALRDMFVALAEAREALRQEGKPILLADVDIDLLRIFASTVLLFPTLPSADPVAIGQITVCLNLLSRALNANSKEDLTADWAGANMHETIDQETLLPERLAVGDRPEAVVERELGDALAEACEALCMAEGKSLWRSDELASIILNLTLSDDPIVAARGLDLFVTAACRRGHFRQLITKADTPSGGAILMDRMSRFLLHTHPRFNAQQRFHYTRDILRALAMLARSDEDAVVLMTEASILVPALVVLLHRQSSLLWGIRSSSPTVYDPMELITPTMLLLHHVMFPPPYTKASGPSQMHKDSDFADPDSRLFASPPPQGAALARLLTAAASTTEFNGVQNFYVSALGPIAYTNADIDDGTWAYAAQPPGDGDESTLKQDARDRDGAASDLRMVQYLAQDLLNAFVEGPEGDSVYEVYDGEGGAAAVVGEEAEVIEVDDDDDFDEEERLMHGTWQFDE